MERLHGLRVALLTALLWLAVFYLFGLAFPESPEFDCPKAPAGEPQQFCITEM